MMPLALLVSTRKGLFSVNHENGRWAIQTLHFPGVNVSLAMTDPRDGAWYAALDHGHFGVKLHRSSNRGATWEEIGVPAYPEPPEGHEEEKDEMGRTIPWKLIRIWALEEGHATEPGVLWAGTLPGGLFKSTDRGATWELVRSLWDDPRRLRWMGGGADYPGIHSICIHPQDPKRIVIAISSGGIWHTSDGGATWAPHAGGMRSDYTPPDQAYDPLTQDPHRMVQSSTRPDVMWVQHHNGIFRSEDGGWNWTELKDVPPSVFGFGVVVHPKDPDTAWFVPAVKDDKRFAVDGKVVVSRTRDGGRTFDVLRNGLPQEHAYDLVYRHALTIDDTGDRLAFGSTTGSLWVTENGGDAWTPIGEHLPPVHAVCFAR